MTGNIDTERVPYGLAVHDHEEENAVLEIIRNHKTIMGEKVQQFENEIAVLFGKTIWCYGKFWFICKFVDI